MRVYCHKDKRFAGGPGMAATHSMCTANSVGFNVSIMQHQPLTWWPERWRTGSCTTLTWATTTAVSFHFSNPLQPVSIKTSLVFWFLSEGDKCHCGDWHDWIMSQSIIGHDIWTTSNRTSYPSAACRTLSTRIFISDRSFDRMNQITGSRRRHIVLWWRLHRNFIITHHQLHHYLLEKENKTFFRRRASARVATASWKTVRNKIVGRLKSITNPICLDGRGRMRIYAVLWLLQSQL